MSARVDQRTLVLLRHAKAERAPGKADHDRELTPRGRRDARAVGQWLRDAADTGLLPSGALDLVLCSTSERTSQTLDAVREGGGSVKETLFDERIYDAGADGLLGLLRDVPDSVGTVLMIGHAPGIPGLATALLQDRGGSADRADRDDPDGDDPDGEDPDGGDPDVASTDAAERVSHGFPTCGLAVLELRDRWASLAPETASLRAFVVPRG